MDVAEIKEILNEAAKKIVVSHAHGVPAAGQPMPVQLGSLPPPIAFPVVSEKIIKVDEVTKQVTFNSSDWLKSPFTSEAIKLPPATGATLANTATQGTIGRMEIRIPEFTFKSLPISLQNIAWTLYKDAACTQIDTGLAGSNPSITVLITPPIAELTDQPLPSGLRRYISASFELSVTVPPPINATVTTGTVKTPCLEIVVPPIGIPSVLALFDDGNFGGAVLVVLPSNSPLKTAGAVSDVANKLTTIVSSIATPVAGLGKLVDLVPALTDLADSLNGAPVARLHVEERIGDLESIVMWTQPGTIPFTTVKFTARDRFGSLYLISGNTAKRVRLYNRAGWIQENDLVHDGGAFTIRAGDEYHAHIGNLATKTPASAPVDTVSAIFTPTGASTFHDKFSSLEWI